jgi:hypothetical protein
MASKEGSRGIHPHLRRTSPLKPLSFSIVSPWKKQPAFVKTSSGLWKEVSRLHKHSLETTDIFRGAFFLCHGGDLCGIRIKNNGKPIASFSITGKDLDKLDRAYRNGQALVNPLQFRESLNHLRDILFNTLRENGGTRYDRERKDRGHKERR